jgi:diguanylate cyclase (GGDEF)-like protein
MENGFNKDYVYLLSRLLPKQLLSKQRLECVLAALAGNSRIDLVREAYLSMEELASLGEFSREGVRHSESGTSVSYRKSGHPSRITLEMSKDEWNNITGTSSRPSGVLPTVLAGIISSLALNNTPKTAVGRLEEMLDLTGHIQHSAEGYLILFHDLPGSDGDRIRSARKKDIRGNDFYRSIVIEEVKHTFIQLNGNYLGKPVFPPNMGTKSIILVPLVAGEREWGVLEIHTGNDETPDEGIFLNYDLLAKGIIRLLQNNKLLETMVSIDNLTKVYNRNYYDKQLGLEMERAIRNKKYLAFLMIDIDDFKSINDRYGHDVGDDVLRLVANTFKSHLRKIDLLFRFGGEEFVVLLPGAGREAAERTAERIREVVSGSGLSRRNDSEVRVTISIGGCIYPTDAQSEAELFKKADMALYASKAKGKNTVTFYDVETEQHGYHES